MTDITSLIKIDGGPVVERKTVVAHEGTAPKGTLTITVQVMHWTDTLRFTYSVDNIPPYFSSFFAPYAEIYLGDVDADDAILVHTTGVLEVNKEYLYSFVADDIRYARAHLARETESGYLGHVKVYDGIRNEPVVAMFKVEEIQLVMSEWAIPPDITINWIDDRTPLDIPEFDLDFTLSTNCGEIDGGGLIVHYGVDVYSREFHGDTDVPAEPLLHRIKAMDGKSMDVTLPIKIPAKADYVRWEREYPEILLHVWAYVPTSAYQHLDARFRAEETYFAYLANLVWVPVQVQIQQPIAVPTVDEEAMRAGAERTARYDVIAMAGYRPLNWISVHTIIVHMPSIEVPEAYLQQIDTTFWSMYWDREISYLPVSEWLHEIGLKWAETLEKYGPMQEMMMHKSDFGRIQTSTIYTPETTQTTTSTQSDYPQSAIKNDPAGLLTNRNLQTTSSSGMTFTQSEESDLARQYHTYARVRTDIIRQMCEEFGRFFI